MGTAQLRLISRVEAPSPAFGAEPAIDPVRRVFEYWLFMSGRNPARTKLGPQRRQAIGAALVLYSEDDLALAVDGNLVDAWCVENGRHDIDWLLVGESRVERFMALGERLREHAARRRTRPAAVPDAPPPDPQAVRAAMQRMREVAAEIRARGGLRG